MSMTNIIDIKTEVTGGKRNLKKNFGLTKEKIDLYIKRSLNRSCRIIQYYARNNHNYKDNPARQSRDGVKGLTRAIRFHVLASARMTYVGNMYIDDKRAPAKDAKSTTTYGTFQRNGTKGSRPTHAKRLKFFIDRDRIKYMGNHKMSKFMGHEGIWVSAKRVKGIQKNDFLKDAYKSNIHRIRAIFSEELRRIINE